MRLNSYWNGIRFFKIDASRSVYTNPFCWIVGEFAEWRLSLRDSASSRFQNSILRSNLASHVEIRFSLLHSALIQITRKWSVSIQLTHIDPNHLGMIVYLETCHHSVLYSKFQQIESIVLMDCYRVRLTEVGFFDHAWIGSVLKSDFRLIVILLLLNFFLHKFMQKYPLIQFLFKRMNCQYRD